MTNRGRSVLSTLFSLGAIFALTACIDPIIIGGNGGGGSGGTGGNPAACMSNADCAAGQACVNGACAPIGPVTCNGMPSPVSCTQTGCADGQVCVPDTNPNSCYPSSCGCDPVTAQWVCTADCGQGNHCVPAQPCSTTNACPPNMTCNSAGQCVPVCVPAPERCNNIDDDCDGAIDEQTDPSVPLCANGAVCVMGQCGGNTICMTDADCPMSQFCINGMCNFGMCSTAEVCNGYDDDCNGVVDDGAGAICADGTICAAGQCGGNPQQCGANTPPCPPGQTCSMGICVPGGCMPAPEICNNVDDDCDGMVDEVTPGAILCPNGGQCVMGQCSIVPLPCGPMTPCPSGQVCNPNGVCTPGMCQPVAETCNGIDDNCNGVIDEATAGATLCPNGGQCVMGQCSTTPLPCSAMNPCPAGQVCNPNGVCSPATCQPVPETCNNKDDDCDGIVDDATPGTTLCSNGGQCVMGQCSTAPLPCGPMNPCPAGQTCNPNGVCTTNTCQPVPEVCNGKDDDCDGIIDDATAGTTLCPNGVCLAGQCKLFCTATNACPSGSQCVNGICQ